MPSTFAPAGSGPSASRARCRRPEWLGAEEVATSVLARAPVSTPSFANEGLTVASYVREQRLQGAHRDLTTSLVDERINVICTRWGTPDPAHFSRLFKGRFGMTPGQARAAARGTLPSARDRS